MTLNEQWEALRMLDERHPSKPTECRECHGFGHLGLGADPDTCPDCKGTGRVNPDYLDHDYLLGMIQRQMNPSFRAAFLANLKMVLGQGQAVYEMMLVTATVAQKRESFLVTMGVWPKTKKAFYLALENEKELSYARP
jgi:hypothetical protein